MATIKLGELLIKANILQESQLRMALAEQQKWGGKLGDILVRMSLLTEDLLIRALSKQLGLSSANLDSVQGIAPHVKAKIPREVARDIGAIPLQLKDENKTLVVAMIEPQNLKQIDLLNSVSKCRISPLLAGRTSIARAFARFYEGGSEGGEADLGDSEASFKVVDSQGRTVVKSLKEVEQQRTQAPFAAPTPLPQPNPSLAKPASPALGAPGVAAPSTQPASTPQELLRGLEDAQRREVAAIKALVEILIEKGVFNRDEYLAKVKR